MGISGNLLKIKKDIPCGVLVVAVSKTRTSDEILEAYNAGHRDFGENKVQEIIQKKPQLPGDIRWHFIGHLQTNKVKYIAPFVSLIHSVDSLKLLTEINKQALKSNRIIDCLLQFHIATEESKFGLDMNEADELLKSEIYVSLENTRITGVMGMATFTEDIALVRKEFKMLNNIFMELKMSFFSLTENFRQISMGMTNDYHIAIDEGATLIRIGSALFGERPSGNKPEDQYS